MLVQFESINSSSSLSLGLYSPSRTRHLLLMCNLFAMPRTPQPLGVTIVLTLRQRLLSAVFTSTNCILSYDLTSRSLVTYYWSVMQMFAAWHISIFCTGPLKGTSEWGLTRCTIIAKPISSLDPAAYAHCWCCSVESLTLQKQPCTYRYLDTTLESMWLSVLRVVVAI